MTLIRTLIGFSKRVQKGEFVLRLWLPTAIARGPSRVELGGHDIPKDAVRRRYDVRLKNFFPLYRPIVDSWRLFDSSEQNGHELIAQEFSGAPLEIENTTIWQSLREKLA